MLVLMHACINTAARRLTLLGPYPTLKLHAPNAAASPAEAASCVTRTQASRLVWRHARPARSANWRSGPGAAETPAAGESPPGESPPGERTRTPGTTACAADSAVRAHASQIASTRAASAASASSPASQFIATRSTRNSAGLWCVGQTYARLALAKYVSASHAGPQYATLPPDASSRRSSSFRKIADLGWCNTATTQHRSSRAVSASFSTILSAACASKPVVGSSAKMTPPAFFSISSAVFASAADAAPLEHRRLSASHAMASLLRSPPDIPRTSLPPVSPPTRVSAHAARPNLRITSSTSDASPPCRFASSVSVSRTVRLLKNLGSCST
mmetsp:Transcript_3087/g.12215  ORF Transcript_3087/g.12215 Transcript_3087/m.12215 type:complete len:330 (-) Transcript_3087:417-1406(-)